MKWIAQTLWDLLTDSRPVKESVPRITADVPSGRGRKPVARGPSMQERYDSLVEELKSRYGVRVRKWRKSSSGCAWEVRYANGTTKRLLESPYPRGPMSCAIFLHEIGHHAIGFGTYRPRCLEEYHAWKWSLDTMRSRGLNVTPAVEKRMADSLRYAVAKAKRRGLSKLPQELVQFA